MPKLIKDGAIVEDSWQPADAQSTPGEGRVCTLAQWCQLDDKSGSAVQLEPGDGIEDLVPAIGDLALVVINFPAFTDGRGFSYGRELRERGGTRHEHEPIRIRGPDSCGPRGVHDAVNGRFERARASDNRTRPVQTQRHERERLVRVQVAAIV